MATKRSPSPPPIGNPTIAPAEGIRLLKQQIESGEKLLSLRPISSDAFNSWELQTKNFLEKAFGRNSSNVSSVVDIGKLGIFFPSSPAELERERAKFLQSKISHLRSLVGVLETELPKSENLPATQEAVQFGRRVFLVHGHDDGLLYKVADYLKKFDLVPVILREQPSAGQTIIEKFESFSDVAYAIVLLTPDDRGGTADTPLEEQHFRARQNVIFELGYFLGCLGRSRVTALYMGKLEIPSDYTGVAFVAVDDKGAWRFELARELKAAGLEIDMNLAV